MEFIYTPDHIFIMETLCPVTRAAYKHKPLSTPISKDLYIHHTEADPDELHIYHKPSHTLPYRKLAICHRSQLHVTLVRIHLGLRERDLAQVDAWSESVLYFRANRWVVVPYDLPPPFRYRDDRQECVLGYSVNGDRSLFIRLEHDIDNTAILSTLHPAGIWLPRTDLLNSHAYLQTLEQQILSEA
jgi:hypothetical protein